MSEREWSERRKLTRKKVSVAVSTIALLLILGGAVATIVTAPVSAQTINNPPSSFAPDPLVMLVNSERIRVQVELSQQSLENGDSESALSYIYTPLSVTFQPIKPTLKSFIGEEKTSKLESTLADIPLAIKSKDSQSVSQQFTTVRQILDDIRAKALQKTAEGNNNNTSLQNGLILQAVVVLLRDSGQFYERQSESSLNLASAYATVIRAETNYKIFSDSLAESRRAEINKSFNELKTKISEKSDAPSILQLISTIEGDLQSAQLGSSASNGVAPDQASSEYANYFATIDSLYKQLLTEVKNRNYDQADALAASAYLDNFENLESPLEKADPQLMSGLEQMMRIDIREKIKAQESTESVQAFISEINVKLATAKQYLLPAGISGSSSGSTASPALVNVTKLSEGFGTYQGERSNIGQADESIKSEVRSNIDQIRIDLDKAVTMYKQGNTEGSLISARLAYLNSYENIETPLRPINPDFTLDMEIKFAELRNLIQTNAPYEKVDGKVIEIRRGLDESERLVSGPGVMAPAIAFSSSFSIIFREGLEGALIIGAILTYLEASRNEKFKKHVYYGILFAIAATAITWVIAQFIIQVSGASKDLIEAIAGVSAVAVLFWVSFWILNKVETKKWIEFVKAKVWKATTTGSVMVFVMLSFFTVYREGFETVLFYQAMISFAKYMEWYVLAGLLAGIAVITGVTLLVRKMGKRLPLRVLFGLTMGVGTYMSIVFIGNAIREFQTLEYISTTPMIGVIPRLDINLATMTGIHPTLETVVAQLILLAVYMAGSVYVLFLRPRRERKIQASRKSRSDLVKHEEDKNQKRS